MRRSGGYTKILLLAVLVVFMAGCSGGGGTGFFMPGDTSHPAVSSTVPADAAGNVAVNANITATFSKAMAPSTITPVNFMLTAPGLTPVAGVVTYDGAATATFTPASSLKSSTTYTATIATGAKDLHGNALTKEYVWTFTTTTTVASQVDYYTINNNNGATFTRSPVPFSLPTGVAGAVSQTINTDGSVTISIDSTSGYADCGFYLYAGTLGNLNGITITSAAGSDPVGVNIWFDKDNSGEYFTWTGDVYSNVAPDAYILGPSSTGNSLSVDAGSTFTSINPGGGNYTLAQLKSGAAAGISGTTPIAIWVGINTSSGSLNATIQSISLN